MKTSQDIFFQARVAAASPFTILEQLGCATASLVPFLLQIDFFSPSDNTLLHKAGLIIVLVFVYTLYMRGLIWDSVYEKVLSTVLGLLSAVWFVALVSNRVKEAPTNANGIIKGLFGDKALI
jgi:hypothetical protein